MLEAVGELPVGEADSFVLHAPLELMARMELIDLVEPSAREAALARVSEIQANWRARGPLLGRPSGGSGIALLDAVREGDLERADRAWCAAASGSTVAELVGSLADPMGDHLGGAGHLSIFLDHLTRCRFADGAAILAGRALIRDIARHPDWRIDWVNESAESAEPAERSGPSLAAVLANPPTAGPPESGFIYPTMKAVDCGGFARDLLGALAQETSIPQARTQLLSVAAMSMLCDNEDAAPYGWTHCLTMPAATLNIAAHYRDPARAIGIAATYVLGFRSALSTQTIDLDWSPAPPDVDASVFDVDVDTAIAIAWHDEGSRVTGDLATFAAAHHDAHLVKYTAACFHEARRQPNRASLYRAAATRLAHLWRNHPSGF